MPGKRLPMWVGVLLFHVWIFTLFADGKMNNYDDLKAMHILLIIRLRNIIHCYWSDAINLNVVGNS